MPRPVLLFTGPWTDRPLEELAARAAEWGYQGLELACWGYHGEVQRILGEEHHATHQLDLLARHDLTAPVLNNRRVGQAVCDPGPRAYRALLPEYVWGDGEAAGVAQRAAQEMADTVRAGQRMGASVVVGRTGSSLWQYLDCEPPLSPDALAAGLEEFALRWAPVLDACRDCGLRLACEVRPGQIAFDPASAAAALDAVNRREEFGFAVDPSVLHWQGVDAAEFVREFPDRIYHVHLCDAALRLNGRRGLLNGYLPPGDPRRGWEPRSPGHGGVDWEGFVRALNEVRYDGLLSVAWSDPGMERDHGAEDACRFVRRLDFPSER
jgi:sugar phosphate isomerase/epimerase